MKPGTMAMVMVMVTARAPGMMTTKRAFKSISASFTEGFDHGRKESQTRGKEDRSEEARGGEETRGDEEARGAQEADHEGKDAWPCARQAAQGQFNESNQRRLEHRFSGHRIVDNPRRRYRGPERNSHPHESRRLRRFLPVEPEDAGRRLEAHPDRLRRACRRYRHDQ